MATLLPDNKYIGASKVTEVAAEDVVGFSGYT